MEPKCETKIILEDRVIHKNKEKNINICVYLIDKFLRL